MTHINFSTGRGRAVLRIAPDGTASLDRTRSGFDAIVNGTWCGYWPISRNLRDRLLRSRPVRDAVRRQAAYMVWQDAVSAHGLGNGVASALFTAAAGGTT